MGLGCSLKTARPVIIAPRHSKSNQIKHIYLFDARLIMSCSLKPRCSLVVVKSSKLSMMGGVHKIAIILTIILFTASLVLLNGIFEN